MATTQPFDPAAFKAAQRADWQVAAPGWRKWYDMLEAGGEIVSRRLVEQAGIGRGDTVLDVATGYGEPALTAARLVVPPGGRSPSTSPPTCSTSGGNGRHKRVSTTSSSSRATPKHSRSTTETFDAVLCRQGLQFLSDVAATLGRLHSFLKRDGRLAAAVWGPPDTVQFARPVSVILNGGRPTGAAPRTAWHLRAG